MIKLDLTPLQLYLRYYAAAADKNAAVSSLTDIQIAVLKSLPSQDLGRLIVFIENALAAGDESANRALFLDGHHYFRWSTTDAATRYLKALLLNAKSVKDNSSVL